MNTNEVPIIGAGFDAFIDHLFWQPQFPSVKQGNSLFEEFEEDLKFSTKTIGPPSAKKSGMSTSWKALPTISSSAEKLGLGNTGQTRVALQQGSSVSPTGSRT